jgi:multiple sugar transport system permease protein
MKRKKFAKLFPFHLPTMVTLMVITLIPFLFALNLSFRAYSLARPGYEGQFIGLDNFRKLLNEDPLFWESILITLRFVLVVVTLELFLGLGIGTLLNQKIWGRRFFTSIIIVPMMIAPVVVGLVWSFLLNAEFGIVSYAIRKVGVHLERGLLGSVNTALPTVMFIDVWQWTPFMTLIMLAALRALPREPVEAAQIDGASGLQVFRYITLPLIKPLIFVAILLRSIDSFKLFDTVFILTGGGPSFATELASIYAYRINFRYWNMGYGSSVVLILFLIVLICTEAFFFFTQREIPEKSRLTR